MTSNLIIGIDLGTTFSVIAKIDANGLGKPEVISNRVSGDSLTTSAICFYGDEPAVGKIAKESCEDNEYLATEFKRGMGQKDWNFEARGKQYNAIDLSEIILRELTKYASEDIGEEIKDVVISVPARFHESEREATIKAGQQAGLNVLAIINEPTAAAIYYAQKTNTNGTVLVYDLGGGTFDVTIMKIDNNKVDIIASGGDLELGGVDFDKSILEIMSDKYLQETDGDLYDENDKDIAHELLLEAEETKKKLSTKDSALVKLNGSNGRAKIAISRDDFEQAVISKIEHAEIIIENLLIEESVNLTVNDIDKILLVGGSTRMPMVHKSIKKIFNKEPAKDVNVDTAIALGAALQAGIEKSKQGDVVPGDIGAMIVAEITNHSFGTEVTVSEKLLTCENSIIIKKNTKIPCSKTKRYQTLYDNQEHISFSITQGEGKDMDHVSIVGEEPIILKLPQGRAKYQPVDATYSFDKNGMMHCLIKDVNTGKTVERKNIISVS